MEDFVRARSPRSIEEEDIRQGNLIYVSLHRRDDLQSDRKVATQASYTQLTLQV